MVSRLTVTLPDVWGSVSVTKYRIGAGCSDRDVLAALIAADEYEGSSLGSLAPTQSELRRRPTNYVEAERIRGNEVDPGVSSWLAVHGPYHLSAITADAYEPIAAQDARSALQAWARDYQEPAADVEADLERGWWLLPGEQDWLQEVSQHSHCTWAARCS